MLRFLLTSASCRHVPWQIEIFLWSTKERNAEIVKALMSSLSSVGWISLGNLWLYSRKSERQHPRSFFLKRNHHILQYKRNVDLVDRLIWQHTCASDLTSPQHQILTPFSTPLNSNKNLEYRQANSLLFSEYTTKQSIDRFSRFFCVLSLDRKYSFVSRVFLE